MKLLGQFLTIMFIAHSSSIWAVGYELEVDNTKNKYKMFVHFNSNASGCDWYAAQKSRSPQDKFVYPGEYLSIDQGDIKGACAMVCYPQINATVNVPDKSKASGYRNGATIVYVNRARPCGHHKVIFESVEPTAQHPAGSLLMTYMKGQRPVHFRIQSLKDVETDGLRYGF